MMVPLCSGSNTCTYLAHTNEVIVSWSRFSFPGYSRLAGRESNQTKTSGMNLTALTQISVPAYNNVSFLLKFSSDISSTCTAVTPVLLLLGSGSGISCILAVSFTSSELSSRCLVYDSGTPCEGEVGEVLRGVSCLLRTS
jgi:hypothetical protein